MSARYHSPLGYYVAIWLFLLFLWLFQCWFTVMPLSPVITYVYASFAKFTCSRFCFVLLCTTTLYLVSSNKLDWIGLVYTVRCTCISLLSAPNRRALRPISLKQWHKTIEQFISHTTSLWGSMWRFCHCFSVYFWYVLRYPVNLLIITRLPSTTLIH